MKYILSVLLVMYYVTQVSLAEESQDHIKVFKTDSQSLCDYCDYSLNCINKSSSRKLYNKCKMKDYNIYFCDAFLSRKYQALSDGNLKKYLDDVRNTYSSCFIGCSGALVSCMRECTGQKNNCESNCQSGDCDCLSTKEKCYHGCNNSSFNCDMSCLSNFYQVRISTFCH